MNVSNSYRGFTTPMSEYSSRNYCGQYGIPRVRMARTNMTARKDRDDRRRDDERWFWWSRLFVVEPTVSSVRQLSTSTSTCNMFDISTDDMPFRSACKRLRYPLPRSDPVVKFSPGKLTKGDESPGYHNNNNERRDDDRRSEERRGRKLDKPPVRRRRRGTPPPEKYICIFC